MDRSATFTNGHTDKKRRKTLKKRYFCTMHMPVKIFMLSFFFCAFFSAQSRADFDLRLRNSYHKLYENPATALHAARELRTDSEEITVKSIVAHAYLLQGDYLESVRVAFDRPKNLSPQNSAGQKIVHAREFYALNLYEQAAKLLSEDPQPFNINDGDPRIQLYFAIFYQLQAQNYLAFRQLEKAENSLTKSAQHAKKAGRDADFITAENALIQASLYLAQNRNDAAEKLAREISKKFQNPRTAFFYASAQQLLAEVLFKKQNYSAATSALLDALEAIGEANYLPLKTKIYGGLATNYLAQKDNERYDEFQAKFTENTRLLEKNSKEARRELVQLRSSLNSNEQEFSGREMRQKLFWYLGFLLIVTGIFTAWYFREIQRAKMLMRQVRFFRLHPVLPAAAPAPESEKPQKKQLFIPEETERELLIKLQDFEDSKKFLDNSMSLASLSAQLDTNTKYLSEIIKKYKNKNFNTYINELRVQHVIELLTNDRTYQQYKISYIAEIGGFTSHSAFTNVFKSITGMSPNEFMQTLKSADS